ncbi:hypothetical protein HYV83_04270 [Candidatus Woesearchaeota archaeon]|nr:hypothetical protein [Candidatus Woesearchaeota archaeon]
MKFIHVYAAWMVVVIVARLAGLISKPVFESLFVIGIVFIAGVSYKSLCELDYAFDKRYGTL